PHLHLPRCQSLLRMRREGRAGTYLTAIVALAAVTPLLAEPSLRTEQVSQLVVGDTAVVLERKAEWRRVRLDRDAYEGWIQRGLVRAGDRPGRDGSDDTGRSRRQAGARGNAWGAGGGGGPAPGGGGRRRPPAVARASGARARRCAPARRTRGPG